VESGALPLASLVTLRRGETVSDNLRGGAARILRRELIKLRGHGGSWRCVCLEGLAGCRIYSRRPLECRTLQCRDTAPLEALSAGPRLVRGDLLQPRPDLLDLVETHERRCDFDRLRALVGALRRPGGDPAAAEAIAAMLRFDAALREAALGRGLAADLLPFLLGRPLADLMPITFGIAVLEREGATVLRDRAIGVCAAGRNP
jgi:hypothetical protein